MPAGGDRVAALIIVVAVVAGVVLLPGCGGVEKEEAVQSAPQERESGPAVTRADPTITVVFDNNPYKEGLATSWGFSCVVGGTEKTILFDTGGEGSILSANMDALGIDPAEIDVVVLSHIHGDHVGGLGAASLEAIISRLKELGVEYVGPCHCSGDMARRLLGEAYGDKYMDVGVGRVIDVGDLD